jgi:hypothetical protein
VIYLNLFSNGLTISLQTPIETPAILWDERYLDILLQVAFIFSGVLGVLGLLSSGKPEIQKEDEE